MTCFESPPSLFSVSASLQLRCSRNGYPEIRSGIALDCCSSSILPTTALDDVRELLSVMLCLVWTLLRLVSDYQLGRNLPTRRTRDIQNNFEHYGKNCSACSSAVDWEPMERHPSLCSSVSALLRHSGYIPIFFHPLAKFPGSMFAALSTSW